MPSLAPTRSRPRTTQISFSNPGAISSSCRAAGSAHRARRGPRADAGGLGDLGGRGPAALAPGPRARPAPPVVPAAWVLDEPHHPASAADRARVVAQPDVLGADRRQHG